MAVIDLTVLGARFPLGAFSEGHIKAIQSSLVPDDPTKITFDELLAEKFSLKRAVLTSFVVEEDWVLPKFAACPDVILLVDNGRAPARVHCHPTYKNTRIACPPFPTFPNYGVQHAKLMLLFYDEWLRLVISTGNLLVFVHDLPKSDDFHAAINNHFRRHLQELLAAFRIDQLMTTGPSLEHYGWGSIRAKLVFSVPGMKHVNGKGKSGLVQLAEAISGLTLDRSDISIECQGSSLGAIDEWWLQDVLGCCCGQIPKSTAILGKRPKVDPLVALPFKIVFPTLQYVSDSAVGPGGFGTVFFQEKYWNSAKFPKHLLYRCESIQGAGQSLHSKTVTLFAKDKPVWHYLGSANFTPSAWGKFVREKAQIMVANYELGVVIASNELREPFPFTYARPPHPYSATDIPWMQNALSTK